MKTDSRLKPCPFCGKVPMIYVCDDEGNIKDDNYELDPWSGLCYSICHTIDEGFNTDCPIATHDWEILGTKLYDTIDELVTAWNTRIAK